MVSLWVVNKCCGEFHVKKYGSKSTGGLWLEAMIDQVKQFADDRVIIVNIEKNPTITYFKDHNITYYTLQGEPNYKYDYNDKRIIASWSAIMDKENPDIIELWGTELPYGLAAIKSAPRIPIVVFVQGILESIAKYYKAGLTNDELKKAISIRDILTKTTIQNVQDRFYKQAKYEYEIIKKSHNIIIENSWAEAYYRSLHSDISVYRMPIAVSDNFKKTNWSEDTMIPYTIMCPAANYPIKGLHMLLKALAIVKRNYANIKLYIPGTKLTQPKSIRQFLKMSGYDRYIIHLINSLGLEKNVIYTGRLTADQMAEKMEKSNVFVMCSAIENHSSTLKEAMAVGIPCVASYVGGVPEYAIDNQNCLLYRFEDYEVLAMNICRIFENETLRKKISTNGKNTIMQLDCLPSGYTEMREIYKRCLANRDSIE